MPDLHALDDVGASAGLRLRGQLQATATGSLRLLSRSKEQNQTTASLVTNPAIFIHAQTGLEFVLVPQTRFWMGIQIDAFTSALKTTHYHPQNALMAKSLFEHATPAHEVMTGPFLIARSPLLSATVEGLLPPEQQRTYREEAPRARSAIDLRFDDASRLLAGFGWRAPTEVEWACAASAGGRDVWLCGDQWQAAAGNLEDSPDLPAEWDDTNRWGLWGLTLGEWLSDRWCDCYPVRSPEQREKQLRNQEQAIRGGAVRIMPFQDSDHALTCLVASRPGASAHGAYAVRPVIPLDGWALGHASLDEEAAHHPLQIAETPSFEEVISPIDAAARRAEKEREARQDATQHARQRLPGTVLEGVVRSAGEPGTYVVRTKVLNGILKLAADAPRLKIGQTVSVRVVGSSGVPPLELVSSVADLTDA